MGATAESKGAVAGGARSPRARDPDKRGVEAAWAEDVADEVAPTAGVEVAVEIDDDDDDVDEAVVGLDAGFSGAAGFEVTVTALLVVCFTGWGAAG